METFYQTFGFIAAVCAGIVILTLFFTALSYFRSMTRGFDIVKMKGFIKDGNLINVHLSNGKTLQGVRFVGFTSQGTGKDGVPYQLSNMMVCENTDAARLLIRADTVKMIEEVASTK